MRGSSGWLPPPASQAGDVGSVGFGTMASSGRVAARLPDAGRAAVGHGAAKAELEAEFDEFVGLLAAAAEGVGDAAGTWRCRSFQDRVHRPPDMENHRQVEFPGEVELLAEKPRLASGVDAGKVMVETGISPRRPAFRLQPGAQGSAIGLLGGHDVEGWMP